MFALIQGSIIFFSCFTTMRNATEVYGFKSDKGHTKIDQIHSGKTADLWLIGNLVYFAVILFSNIKILQDSHNLTPSSILFNILSTLAFIGCFYKFNQNTTDSLFKHFDHIWHFSQYMLCALFFLLAMWPINNLF